MHHHTYRSLDHSTPRTPDDCDQAWLHPMFATKLTPKGTYTDVIGPEVAPLRIVVPGTASYVELRQERHGDYFGYCVETGSVEYGHRGTWGRHDLRSATECFADAVSYAAVHHVRCSE